MNISTETREILRNYRAVINARRREMGQKDLFADLCRDARAVVAYAEFTGIQGDVDLASGGAVAHGII